MRRGSDEHRIPPETVNGHHAGSYSDLVDDLRELLTALRELLTGKRSTTKSRTLTPTRVLLSKLAANAIREQWARIPRISSRR